MFSTTETQPAIPDTARLPDEKFPPVPARVGVRAASGHRRRHHASKTLLLARRNASVLRCVVPNGAAYHQLHSGRGRRSASGRRGPERRSCQFHPRFGVLEAGCQGKESYQQIYNLIFSILMPFLF